MGYVQAAVAAASAIYGIVQGERSSQAQKKGLRLQKEAQDAATAQAMRQERASSEQYARENAKIPDIGAMLTSAQDSSGYSSLLSGTRGNAGRSLGRPTLLGG